MKLRIPFAAMLIAAIFTPSLLLAADPGNAQVPAVKYQSPLLPQNARQCWFYAIFSAIAVD